MALTGLVRGTAEEREEGQASQLQEEGEHGRLFGLLSIGCLG